MRLAFAFEVLLFVVSLSLSQAQSASPELSAQAGQAPYFINEPIGNTNVVEGASFTFTTVAEGTSPLAYQWLRNLEEIPGATLPALELSNLTERDSGLYQVIVRNAFGQIKSSTNGFLSRLLVKPRFPRFPPQGPDIELKEGQAYTGMDFQLYAVAPITYQWYKDGQIIPGATTSGICWGCATGFVEPSDAGEYKLVATTPYGPTSSAPLRVVVTTAPPTFFWNPPSSVLLNKDERLDLTVLAFGSPPLQYQWFKDGVLLPGANSTNFVIAQAQTLDSGGYYAVVTDSHGLTRTSDVCHVEVSGALVLLSQPQGRTDLFAGDSFTLGVSAVGGSPISVLWYRDGEYLPMSADYGWSLPFGGAVAPIDSGNYWAVITNPYGSLTSEVARVEVQLREPHVKRPTSPSAPHLADDLVAYWPFDEVKDGTTPDLVNGLDLRVSSVFTGRRGNSLHVLTDPLNHGGAYRLDRPGEPLPINQHPAFTITAWVQLSKGTGGSSIYGPSIFQEGNTADTNTVFAISNLVPHATITFTQAPWPAVKAVPTIGRALTDNGKYFGLDWQYLAFVQMEDGTRWFYINGREDEMNIPPKPAGEWQLDYTSIGGGFVPGTLSSMFCCIPGELLIDDVAVWKRALSEEEIRKVMVDGPPAASTPQSAISSLAFDSDTRSLRFGWSAPGPGTYAVFKAGKLAGEWVQVDAGQSASTNMFLEVIPADGQAFYQLRWQPSQ